MSTTRQVQLDRDHLIQMARSPDFYAAVPAFAYLQDVATETWRQLQTKAGCQKCYHEWNAMRGICDALKRWVAARKGYPVSTCVLYYRRSREQGQIAKLEF